MRRANPVSFKKPSTAVVTTVLSRGEGEDVRDAYVAPFAEVETQPGNSTVSITWMTPLDCITLRMVT